MPDRPELNQTPALVYAVRLGRPSTVRAVLEAHAGACVPQTWDFGCTCLRLALPCFQLPCLVLPCFALPCGLRCLLIPSFLSFVSGAVPIIQYFMTGWCGRHTVHVHFHESLLHHAAGGINAADGWGYTPISYALHGLAKDRESVSMGAITDMLLDRRPLVNMAGGGFDLCLTHVCPGRPRSFCVYLARVDCRLLVADVLFFAGKCSVLYLKRS